MLYTMRLNSNRVVNDGEQMPSTLDSKYPYEYILDFQSNDRFLYRISDLEATGECGKELRQRLDKCQIYVLARRPRLTIVPGSIEATNAVVRLKVQYHLAGLLHQVGLDIPRHFFKPEEVTFEASAYPHRWCGHRRRFDSLAPRAGGCEGIGVRRQRTGWSCDPQFMGLDQRKLGQCRAVFPATRPRHAGVAQARAGGS